MDLLHKAVTKGSQTTEVLKNDADFEPLRSRADFKKLLDELAAR
jgi:hypothetical protein